jgi:hypothetical protein
MKARMRVRRTRLPMDRANRPEGKGFLLPFSRRICGIHFHAACLAINEAYYARHLLGTMAPYELPRNTAGREQGGYEIFHEYYKAIIFWRSF